MYLHVCVLCLKNKYLYYSISPKKTEQDWTSACLVLLSSHALNKRTGPEYTDNLLRWFHCSQSLYRLRLEPRTHGIFFNRKVGNITLFSSLRLCTIYQRYFLLLFSVLLYFVSFLLFIEVNKNEFSNLEIGRWCY